MKIFILTPVLGLLFVSAAFAGPGNPLFCHGASVFEVKFVKAISGPLIWGSVLKNGARVAVAACALSRTVGRSAIYVCENGVDDRYNNNKENFRIFLTRNLNDDSSEAVLLKGNAVLAELPFCHY